MSNFLGEFLIIIFGIILLGYVITNIYFGTLILKKIKIKKQLIKIIYWTIFSFIFLAFIISSIFASYIPEDINRVIYVIGAYYLSVYLYGIVIFVISKIINIYLKKKGSKVNIYMFSIILLICVEVIGVYSSKNTKITEYSVRTNKLTSEQQLKIAMVSDIHLGNVYGKNDVKEIVDKVNDYKPDIVLIPGDLVDGDLSIVLSKDMLSPLKELRSTYGTYMTLGNHDIYTNETKKLEKVLNKNNVTLLKEECKLINNSFYLAGMSYSTDNNDYDSKLNYVLKDTDNSKPIILLDHNPINVDSVINKNVDLLVSGHTHKGQFFPGNLVTDMLYKIDYGFKKYNNTNVVVSSGYGTWGPPIRVCTKSEIVEINLKMGEE